MLTANPRNRAVLERLLGHCGPLCKVSLYPNGHVELCLSSTKFATWPFNFSNSSGHRKRFFLLSSGHNGADLSATAERFSSKLYIDRIKDFGCDSVRDGLRFLIESAFRISGVSLVGVKLWPSHSHSF